MQGSGRTSQCRGGMTDQVATIGPRMVEAAERIIAMARCGAGGGAVPLRLTVNGREFVAVLCMKEDLPTWSPPTAQHLAAKKRER